MTYANIFNDFCTRLQKSVNLFCRNMQKSVNPKPLYFIKNPCGEPQGWDKKLYIFEDCLSNIIGSAGEYLSNNAYKSKLFSSNKNWRKPSIKIPSSLRRGRISSFTTIIFLNESGIARKGRSSCLTFSSDGKAYAD